jgi:PEGA domain
VSCPSKVKTAWALSFLVVAVVSAWGGASAPSSNTCEKNVSFAVTADGQPVAAVPGFAAHWISDEKHHKQYAGLCFAQSPDPRARNYLVMFSTRQESLNGLAPSVLKYVNSAPISENTAINEIYGQMWHFTSDQPAAAGTTTLSVLHADTSTVLFARVYNEQGTTISQRSLSEVSGWLHTKEKFVDRILGDIAADSRPLTASQATLKASVPVYYVNCDVPVKSLANEEPGASSSSAPPARTTAPVPVATLEFWSSPPGADLYVDGALVGKTPSSLTISLGEHTITMRKPNFGSWQRKMQITDGKRKITGYLEQKVVTLGSGQQ